jgi:hypothetical protein
MAAARCAQCGGMNPPGAAFCQYCGSPITGAAGTPLAQGTPPPLTPPSPPPYPAMGGYPPQGSPQRSASRVWKIVVIAVAVILVIGFLAFFLFPVGPSIQVNDINLWSPDNVCGLDGEYTYGFNASTGSLVPLAFNITGAPYGTGSNTSACTIDTVVTNTSGFSVSDANVPLVIPANTNETLYFNVQCPGSSYSGDLNLVMT